MKKFFKTTLIVLIILLALFLLVEGRMFIMAKSVGYKTLKVFAYYKNTEVSEALDSFQTQHFIVKNRGASGDMAEELGNLLEKSYNLIGKEFDYFPAKKTPVFIYGSMEEFWKKNKSYWTGHDLNSIPHHLLERISELGDCALIEPDLNHIYEPSKKIIDSMSNAKQASTFASYFNPAYLPLYVELGRKDAELSLNFTQSVWDHLSNKHSSMINELMGMDNVSLYVSKEGIKLTEITVTDKTMLLGLFDNQGKFDQQFIMSSEPSALLWCQELFDYFKRLSRLVNKI